MVSQPEEEEKRLSALRSYAILDTPAEGSFDDLTRLAAQICETPIALISLVDRDRLWFKSKFGMNTAEVSRDKSFCAMAIARPDRALIVGDAAEDARFSSSALVTSAPHVRFYGGAPLVTPGGHALGTLCVIDDKPRQLGAEQVAALETLGKHVVAQMELRRNSAHLVEEIYRRERAEDRLREQSDLREQETSRLLDLAEKSRQALLSVLEDEQRAGHNLARSNRALKMLSLCNEAMMLAEDEAGLLSQVCRIAVELGGHEMAWVGYAQHDEDRTIKPMGQCGDNSGYLSEVSSSWAESKAGRGPAGRAIREGVVIACPDIRDPASGFQAVEAAERRGYRSVICLPLKEGNRAYGMLALYSGETHSIRDDEVELLQGLASDLAFGIGSIRNRAVRERAEEALVGSLREKEALLKEVHHRVKNNLQVITSLLRIEGRRIDHAVTKTVLDQMQGRIQSMALLHETLYRSGNFARVDLASYLSQLTTQLFRAQVGQPGTVLLHLDLEAVPMDIDQAIPCGLIVNELASNSLKHAFADGRSGDVWIGLHTSKDGTELTLSLRDNGPGLPKDFDQKRQRSLGLQLVSDLARQIQGTLTVGPGPETSFEVTFVRSRMPTTEIPRLTTWPHQRGQVP